MTLKRTARSVSEVNLNKNVNWLNAPGIWIWYSLLIIAGWALLTILLDDPGLAWTYTHLGHGVVTYYLLHWTKGSPCSEEQGKYDYLTFWEQIDNGMYGTNTRKFLMIVPVALFTLATHGTDFRKQPMGANLVVVIVLVLAKLPFFHKVRILGIGRY